MLIAAYPLRQINSLVLSFGLITFIKHPSTQPVTLGIRPKAKKARLISSCVFAFGIFMNCRLLVAKQLAT